MEQTLPPHFPVFELKGPKSAEVEFLVLIDALMAPFFHSKIEGLKGNAGVVREQLRMEIARVHLTLTGRELERALNLHGIAPQDKESEGRGEKIAWNS
jgi:hypothetical protein